MSLTKFKEGSLAEIMKIAFPLMLSSFSVMFMLFIDRLLLASYGTEALTAAVKASTLGWVFMFGYMVFTSVSEVFVAQYNGANRRDKLGEPVWQTIWLALLSFVLFIPLSLFGGEMFFGASQEAELERLYFGWMMLFSPFFAIYSALCGFFVGQGKTLLITSLALVANLVNAALDVILIFGWEGYIPSMGIAGAAIATSASGVFQALVLMIFFLQEKYRHECRTDCYQINWVMFFSCIKFGFPAALFAGIEVLGWALFYAMMAHAGEFYIVIAGICQSICILFYFIGEGVSKAAATLTGNLIGAKKHHAVINVLRAGTIMHVVFIAFLALAFWLANDWIITLFLPDKSADYIASIKPQLVLCLYGVLCYIFIEGLRLLVAGILTAAGDTMFLLLAGTSSVWLLLVIPVYLIVYHSFASTGWAWVFCALYNGGAFVILLARFFNGKWKRIQLTDTMQGSIGMTQ